MNLLNILKNTFSSTLHSSPKQYFPTPKDILTDSDEQQISDLQKLLPEGREFRMYDGDSVIQVVFSVNPNLTSKRIANLKSYRFSVLTQYTCKCCSIDYVMIIKKY